MPTFKYLGTDPISLFAKPGNFDAMSVEPGALIEAPGRLVSPEDGGFEDAYHVDSNGEVRAWSKTQWELQTGKSADSAADKEK